MKKQNKKTAVILQARMGSSRLPGKVLKDLCGKTILERCLDRLKMIHKSVLVVVATTNQLEDKEIVKVARANHVPYFQGSEENVLERYYQAAKEYGVQYIIRATADNPAIDPYEAKKTLDYILSHDVDYVSAIDNVQGFSLPIGVGVEAFTLEALEESWKNAIKKEHKEHINEYLLEHVNNFKIHRMKCGSALNCPDLSLTIDYHKDFEFFENMMSYFQKPWECVSSEEIIQWYYQNKEK
jgi:spore coat polysaccharide biosynthesis protein SpsF